MLQQMADANPQVRAMLNNPALMRAAMTPENLAAAQQMMQGGAGVGGMGAMGGQPGSMAMPGGGPSVNAATG